ncbi:MAG: hypothetical protein AAGC65_25955 [Mucilaginibacter sp.]|uniref:hypothetical protein n=1 Tax=Mucilaginibacter sp. TaxID=1882438 RepID=UPI0031A6A348
MAEKKNGQKYRLTDLTMEEIRECPGLQKLSDQEAQEFIATLKEYTVIIFNYYRRKTRKSLESSE